MKRKPDNFQRIVLLMNRGVNIPNPVSLYVGDEVNLDQISDDGVTIYPGCRIAGENTVISAGAQIGREGPVTIEDCQIGPEVELKAGYFKQAVFLEKASMGSGAHVREGCIFEEEAGGAHCVGLKQTILFPFVTLGSLINFCDCLMSGGTSRKNHSEVGSSYIHFNFTPSGDKTTPSLIGDVPRGVMLNQPPIFLGGQGGMVGPLRLDYGNVVAAGTILRKDCLESGKLIVAKTHRPGTFPFIPDRYPDLSHILENNILYLANLAALEQWYCHVRRPFFLSQELGLLIYEGVLDKLALAREERIKRLRMMTEKIDASFKPQGDEADAGRKEELSNAVDRLSELLSGEVIKDSGFLTRNQFLEAFWEHQGVVKGPYLEGIRSLPAALSQHGTLWLQKIVDSVCRETAAMVPSLNLFKGLTRAGGSK